MLSNSEIFDQIITTLLDREKFYSIEGKAVNVNEDERTCDIEPIEDIAPRSGIKLQAAISGTNGFVLIPKEDSFIVVSFFDTRTGFVSLTSELEKIIWDVELTQINGGDNGGLINIEPLIDKINQLEDALNSHITIFNSHIHITTATVGTGPPGVIAPTTPGDTSNTITPTTSKSDLEDTNVIH